MVAILPVSCLLRTGKNPSTLTYKLPTTITVPVGALLPGTNISYQGMSGDSARVLIGGEEALKRKGDSLNWQGAPINGVTVELKLRIVWYTEMELRLLGTAKVIVEGIDPQMGAAVTTSEIEYTGAVAYGMAVGAVIPGSTLTYEGKFEEGAKLGGLTGYAYREEGDSIQWEGSLRPGVQARLSLRVAQFDARGLRVIGTVTLWIG
jgi:hypothetical protein